ncbi:MAG: hypothetical protein WDM89_03245 [Rhizomicrobium sp.]
MLRGSVIAVGAVCFVGGLVAMLTGFCPPAYVAIMWGVLILLGTAWEKVIYKPLENGQPGSGWSRTSERFIDDATGAPVTVWVDATGERKYVKD